MKRLALTLLAAALATAGFSATAQGPYQDPRHEPTSRSDNARVTRVERMSRPQSSHLRQECWNERTSSHEGGYYRDDSGRLYRESKSGNTGGALVGALIGGALGNQVGGGDGRTAATIAGAVIGASVGNRTGNKQHDGRNDGYDHYRETSGIERRCRTVEEFTDRGRGRGRDDDAFRVTYVYAGQTYQAMTHRNPGRTLRVVVDVRPQDEVGGYIGYNR